MTRGILAYGGYIPLRRLSRAAIAQANGWFNSALKSRAKGERAMANWDEDSVTMAVAAARDCLGERDRDDISALHFASTSFPFLDRLNAGIVAGALNLKSETAAHDHAATQRAGTSALALALEAADSGPPLVIAADKRQTKAAGTLEMDVGDGAAALLVGSGDVIAELVGKATRTIDFVDHYRADGFAYDYPGRSAGFATRATRRSWRRHSRRSCRTRTSKPQTSPPSACRAHCRASSPRSPRRPGCATTPCKTI